MCNHHFSLVQFPSNTVAVSILYLFIFYSFYFFNCWMCDNAIDKPAGCNRRVRLIPLYHRQLCSLPYFLPIWQNFRMTMFSNEQHIKIEGLWNCNSYIFIFVINLFLGPMWKVGRVVRFGETRYFVSYFFFPWLFFSFYYYYYFIKCIIWGPLIKRATVTARSSLYSPFYYIFYPRFCSLWYSVPVWRYFVASDLLFFIFV